MKNKTLLVSIISLCLLVLVILTGCRKEEKAAAKPQAQVPGEEFLVVNEAVYKTRTQEGKEKTYLSTDFSAIERPSSIEEFSQAFHFPPLRQYNTNTCWSFATTSFLESELKRLGKGEVKLSEMHTVYWEYIEKARRFVREKGNSAIGEGSEHNAVIERIKPYGVVRAQDYSGLLTPGTEHDHRALFREFRKYLEFCKTNSYWDEDKAISYVKEILNKYLGPPPETIKVAGKTITPREYAEKELQLPLDDYVCFISFTYLPFYTKGEFRVPDNWWHSQGYYNIPLEEFVKAIREAVQNGFTVALGGDVSEPGISGEDDLAIIPSFDMPGKYIDQDSREFRFSNMTSADDHAIHLVGFMESGGQAWYLIKDSGRGAHVGRFRGYYFYREDYVKLKMLTFMVHRDAVREVLQKFSEVR